MNNIKWQEGAVCYFAKKQWFPNNSALGGMLKGDIHHYNYGDFQLNEIREGDFIAASELDTEQKYNEVVEVFGLFGFEFGDGAIHSFKDVGVYGNLTICHDGIYATELTKKWCKRQLTYSQIIAIGKLKRMMLDNLAKSADDAVDKFVDRPIPKYVDVSHHEVVSKLKSYDEAVSDVTTNKPLKRNKSKQAYDILKSLDYEYDLVKRKWFKKQYID